MSDAENEEYEQQEQEEQEAPQEVAPEAVEKPRHSMASITPLKLPEGEKVEFDEISRKRHQKDLEELQALIAKHFDQRRAEEEELEVLRLKLEKRKEERAERNRLRQQKEKERLAREREERKLKEQEEEKKRQEEEEKKRKAIANMSLHYGGYLARAEKNKPNKRQTEREKKKKILADRKKPLNVDHMNINQLREKAKELWDYLYTLEEEKIDAETRIDRQKYDLNQLRQRVNEYMGKYSKNKAKVKVAGHGGVAKTASAFK
uniref:Smooth muscle-type troponin T n=1 Tax=Botryllus schlosseri TaxID=30301 RepID=C0MP48_BOTSH|nr:smooth muscle-type troponin T [Botryllus schlosseri]